MTEVLLTTLYKELNLPKELKGTLSECLGVEIPVEVKEKVDTNEITIQINFINYPFFKKRFNGISLLYSIISYYQGIVLTIRSRFCLLLRFFLRAIKPPQGEQRFQDLFLCCRLF